MMSLQNKAIHITLHPTEDNSLKRRKHERFHTQTTRANASVKIGLAQPKMGRILPFSEVFPRMLPSIRNLPPIV